MYIEDKEKTLIIQASSAGFTAGNYAKIIVNS